MSMKKVILEVLRKKVASNSDYLSAIKISEIFDLSLAFVYLVVKNEKVKSRKKFGRIEYDIVSFLETLEFKENIDFIENPLSKEDFDINNYYNWFSKNEIEKFLENILLDELGEFTSTKKLVELFGISKTSWYEILEKGKLIYFNIESRKVIITRSLLPYLREAMQEKE